MFVFFGGIFFTAIYLYVNTACFSWGNLTGKVKAIGVSNYTVNHLEELETQCRIPPSVLQVSTSTARDAVYICTLFDHFFISVFNWSVNQ